MKTTAYLLLLILFFASCSETKWSDVTVNNKYALQLPSYLEPGNFTKDASLQYQNTGKEFYLMMIDEDKAQFVKYGLEYDLATYFKVAATKYDTAGLVAPTLLKLGSDSARTADFKGTINGNEVLFKILAIETKTSFYKLIIWMMYRDKDSYAPDVDRIIHSFHQLDTRLSINK